MFVFVINCDCEFVANDIMIDIIIYDNRTQNSAYYVCCNGRIIDKYPLNHDSRFP
jgi:hypothetical protein